LHRLQHGVGRPSWQLPAQPVVILLLGPCRRHAATSSKRITPQPPLLANSPSAAHAIGRQWREPRAAHWDSLSTQQPPVFPPRFPSLAHGCIAKCSVAAACCRHRCIRLDAGCTGCAACCQGQPVR
jgi:hypothetical protein